MLILAATTTTTAGGGCRNYSIHVRDLECLLSIAMNTLVCLSGCSLNARIPLVVYRLQSIN